MTYAGLLERLIDTMALGRNGDYEDGVWLDITHRTRFGRMLRRALQDVSLMELYPKTLT